MTRNILGIVMVLGSAVGLSHTPGFADEITDYLQAREAELCVQKVDGECADQKGFKQRFVYSAHAVIRAPATRIWDVLMNVKSYGKWNSFMPFVRSGLKVGDLLLFKVKLENKFSGYEVVKISVRNENTDLCWGSSPLGELFKTERCKHLKELRSGETIYYTTEKFKGKLAEKTIRWFGEAVQKGIQKEAIELQNYVEAVRSEGLEDSTLSAEPQLESLLSLE